jgi:hypothetical protein
VSAAVVSTAVVSTAGASTAGASTGASSAFLQETVAKTATNAKLKSTFFILLSYKRLIINSEQRYKFFNSKNYFLIFFQKNNILQLLNYLTITVPKIKNHRKISNPWLAKNNYIGQAEKAGTGKNKNKITQKGKITNNKQGKDNLER